MNVANAILQSPFVQTALPIIVTVLVAVLVNNKHLDDLRTSNVQQFFDLHKRFDALRSEMELRFEHLEKVWDAKLARMEGVMDARLRHLEEDR